jgi:hypothetical protein
MFVETNSEAERRTRVYRVLHLELECALPVAVVIHAIVSSAEQLETSVRQEKQLECREGTMVIEDVLYDTGRDLLTPVCLETVGQYRLAWAGWVAITEIDEIDRCPCGAGHIQKNNNFGLVRHRVITDQKNHANKPREGPKGTEKIKNKGK